MSTRQTDPNWTFFNHYIFFPKDAPKHPKASLAGSILLGIFTLGFTHGICGATLGIKKLFGRASKNTPPISSRVSDRAADKFQSEKVDLLKDVDVKALTPENIRKMSPDEQGALIDQHAKRKEKGGSDLTQLQLNGMIRPNTSTVKIINEQETGKGHCGRYAINNAFQKDELTTEDFLRLIADCCMKELNLSREDAEELVNNDADFGIDAGVLEYILNEQRQPIKYSEIHALPECDSSKQRAMEEFIGDDAKWAIIANIGTTVGDAIYEMPSPTIGSYALAKGHFVALRKDDDNEWWYIDSRAPRPVNIALAVIPRSCLLVVPTHAQEE